MKVTGIIAEYNPLHNGHLYQLQQARLKTQADLLVVCLSGNYVQRGEPAILNKWLRTRLALEAGADLVVELPFHFAVQPADRFATGAVAQLAALGCQTLVFGSEDATFDYQTAGNQIAGLPAQAADFVDYRKTYATQLNERFQTQLGLTTAIGANHLLGLSYASANSRLGSPLTLMALARLGAQHADTVLTGPFASASAIRQALQQAQPPWSDLRRVLPSATVAALAGPLNPTWQQLWPFLKYRIESQTLAQLQQIYQMSEGLEYRLKKVIPNCHNFNDLLQALKTKRYTYARLKRLCLYVLLNIQATEMLERQPYTRLLGFNTAGQAYLRTQKKHLTWPLINKVSAKLGAETGLLGLEVRVDRLIEQLTQQPQNFAQRPIFDDRKDR